MATYPGTVSPLRGLSPFAESERDVFFGRDRECEELARLIIGEGFRAGLLYGAPGVGKTSLLRAGVLPYLRDHGVVVLVCDDPQHPIDAFSRAVTAATGLEPAQGERPLTFLARAVGQSMAGQLYLFIIDEVEDVLATKDERLIVELGDLFARVAARSAGRARFLFSCASDRVHLFSELERRTGSLFPPSARFELERLSPATAADVLERTLVLSGTAADSSLPRAIVDELSPLGSVLPADLQTAALAVRELGYKTADDLERGGGAGDLVETWISAACRATGRERAALRLLAELSPEAGQAYVPEWAAARASTDPEFAARALALLADKGMVRRISAPAQDAGSAEPAASAGAATAAYVLAHEVLIPRVREVAAPVRASARRAFELLGSKTAQNKRLSLREWRALRAEGIEPATPAETAVLRRTRRFFLGSAGAIAAAPLLALVTVYVLLAGSYHLAIDDRGGQQRVVARAGDPSLESFYWMPHSPSFGATVADTGLTPALAADDAWDAIAAGASGQEVDLDRLGERVDEALRPTLRTLVEYGAEGSDRGLRALRRETGGGGAFAEILDQLAPIARGGRQERAVVEQALGESSPSVRAAALGVAVSAERRHEGAYRDLLAEELSSEDDQQRRLAFAAVRELGDDDVGAIVQHALASGPPDDARRELFAAVDRDDEPGRATSPASATSLLASEDLDEDDRERARSLLERSFLVDPAPASRAAASLAANADAPADERVFALELLYEQIDEDVYDDVASDIEAAADASAESVRAAALPVYTRLDPAGAAGELAEMQGDDTLSPAMREAMARGWGEVVPDDRQAAQAALDQLLEDRSRDVRAAAARAYGRLGRAAQRELGELIDDASFQVKVGAAYGLASSAVHGGSGPRARGAIHGLWRERGRARRAAAEVYAHMAREVPALVVGNVYQAARHDRDDSLHPIGVAGLCNGVAAGNARARQFLVRTARDASAEVRRPILECALDHADHGAMATRIARELAGEDEADIRAEAARVLARVAEVNEDPPESAGAALIDRARDSHRAVRLAALRGLARLGPEAPEDTAETLADGLAGADEAESLAILQAARATGAGEIASLALTDAAPRVRVSAMETALETGAEAGAALSSAMTDRAPSVRRAALERIAAGDHALGDDDISDALELAIRDEDPQIERVALRTLARVGDVDDATARLEPMLTARSEAARARATSALEELAARAPERARELLEPRLEDPSHDVRRAALPGIAAAYAQTESASDLTERVRAAEAEAARRLAATAGLVALAEDDPTAAEAALEELAEGGPPMARRAAGLGRGLVAADADGVTFLAELLP